MLIFPVQHDKEISDPLNILNEHNSYTVITSLSKLPSNHNAQYEKQHASKTAIRFIKRFWYCENSVYIS